MNRLRIIPVDETVVFPGMPITLSVDVGSDDRVLLVPRQQTAYARVGVVAEVSERVRLAGRGLAVSLTALHRAIPGGAATGEDGVLRVECEPRPDQAPAASLTRELEREYRAVVDEILELRGDDGRIRAFVRSITDAGALADTAGYSPDLNFGQKLQLLETLDVVERLKLALQFQRERLAELQVRSAFETMSRTVRKSSNANISCVVKWTPFARSWVKTTAPLPTSTVRRSPMPACPIPCVSRPIVSWLVSRAWGSRTRKLA